MSSLLPNFTAGFNLVSTVLLVCGYAAIRRRDIMRHRAFMIAALVSSACFLAVYLTHHHLHGSTPYPYVDWTRPIYYLILWPHVVLAAVMTPFILAGVVLAARGRFAGHATLMRRVLPVWLYVSITGVIVYLMLYIQPLVRG